MPRSSPGFTAPFSCLANHGRGRGDAGGGAERDDGTLGAVSLRITVGLNRPGRPPLRGLEDPLAVKASLEDGDFGLQIPDHTIEFVRTGRIPFSEPA